MFVLLGLAMLQEEMIRATIMRDGKMRKISRYERKDETTEGK